MDIGNIKDKIAITGVLIVRVASVRTAKNGSQFLNIDLEDIRGNTINAKKWDWDSAYTLPKPGEIVKVSGKGNMFKERMQFQIDQLCVIESDPTSEEDRSQQTELDAIRKKAKSMQAECEAKYNHLPRLLDDIENTVAHFENDSIRKIVSALIQEAKANEQLVNAPAAQMLHHAERGGLLHHITTMLKMGRAVLDVYTHLDSDLLLAGIIIHDLGKLKEFSFDENGSVSDYTNEGKLIGHLVRGAMDIERIAKEVNASSEKAMLLQHLVLSHHGRLEFGSPVLPKIPEAEVLSQLDLLDARIFQMRAALEPVKDGSFSERMWALDNRELYKMSSDEVS